MNLRGDSFRKRKIIWYLNRSFTVVCKHLTTLVGHTHRVTPTSTQSIQPVTKKTKKKRRTTPITINNNSKQRSTKLVSLNL
jgi:hypothetical protein